LLFELRSPRRAGAHDEQPLADRLQCSRLTWSEDDRRLLRSWEIGRSCVSRNPAGPPREEDGFWQPVGAGIAPVAMDDAFTRVTVDRPRK
jgi:hypothetical protein